MASTKSKKRGGDDVRAIFFYILFIVGIFLIALPLNIYSAKIGICDGLIEYFTKRTKDNGFDEIIERKKIKTSNAKREHIKNLLACIMSAVGGVIATVAFLNII